MHWDPRNVAFNKQGHHFTLYPSVLSLVFNLQMNNVVDISPKVVILLNMIVKTISLFIELTLRKIADEAFILDVIVSGLLLISELGEGVDDDTKTDV
jgi:hypothetical protein